MNTGELMTVLISGKEEKMFVTRINHLITI